MKHRFLISLILLPACYLPEGRTYEPPGGPMGAPGPAEPAPAEPAPAPPALDPATPVDGAPPPAPAPDAGPPDAPRPVDIGSPDLRPALAADAGPGRDTALPGPGGELAARMDFFRTDVVHQIDITIAPAIWQDYLEEHRNFDSDAPRKWYQADFRIDGTELRGVGFHSFGWGSRGENRNKPNLSLDTNHYILGQSLRGIERMRIKNNGQDVSGLRQTILYQAMRGSSLMAPRSTFAELSVNGQPYGFYFVEESFTRGFVQERTGNSNGAAYEPAGCHGLVTPRGQGCEGMTEYFQRNFNDTVAAPDHLAALCRAVSGPPQAFLAAVAPYIVLQEWVDQLAIDTALAGNRDGFSTAGANFRLYHDTALNKLRLIILGPDDTFVPDDLPEPSFLRPEPTSDCLDTNSEYRDTFLEKLVATPEGLALYQASVRKLRTGVLAPGRVRQQVDTLWAFMGSRALADPLRSREFDPEESKDAILEFVDLRWRALEAAGF
jgi:hypothetical protein